MDRPTHSLREWRASDLKTKERKKIRKKGKGNDYFDQPLLKIVLVDAKLRMGPLTMPMPRSSEAFNSSTMEANSLGPYNCLAQAKIVEVFPVPGGP